jgi:drug/metabolite transporter (DMT)-like permease
MSRAQLGFLLGVVGVLVFGGTLPMTRLAVVDLAPLFITAGRAAGAGLIALGVVAILRCPLPMRSDLVRIAAAGAMLVWGFPGLMALGMRSVPASHGGVILALLPIATAVAATLVAGERPSRAFWSVSAAGALLVAAFTLRSAEGGLTLDHGWLVLSVALCSLGYAISGELGRRMASWEVISWLVIVQLPLTLPLAFLSLPADAGAVAPRAWLAFAYLMVLSQYLGFFAWNAGLALGGVAKVGQVQLLQTFVTLGFAYAINGEAVGWETLAFAAAVVALVVAAQRLRVARA